MGWLYNIKKRSDVFVLKTQPLSEHLNGVGATGVMWYDETSESWQESPLSDFCPPKEKH